MLINRFWEKMDAVKKDSRHLLSQGSSLNTSGAPRPTIRDGGRPKKGGAPRIFSTGFFQVEKQLSLFCRLFLQFRILNCICLQLFFQKNQKKTQIFKKNSFQY